MSVNCPLLGVLSRYKQQLINPLYKGGGVFELTALGKQSLIVQQSGPVRVSLRFGTQAGQQWVVHIDFQNRLTGRRRLACLLEHALKIAADITLV
jgi:hypothetical protein